MKTVSRFLCIMIIFACCFSFVSCFLYSDETKNEMNKAHVFIEKFFSEISKGDISEAEKYMHPQFLKDEGNLSDYLAMWEKSEEMDFSQGIYIDYVAGQCISKSHDLYNGYKYEGYKISYYLIIGNERKKCDVYVCDNDDGYGIYDTIFSRYTGIL